MASHVQQQLYFDNPYPDYEDNQSDFKSIQSLFSRHDFDLKKFISDLAFDCMAKLKASSKEKYCDGGLYTGNLGVIFMAYKLIKSGQFAQYDSELRKYCIECLNANQAYYSSANLRASRDVAFLLGRGGFIIMGCLVSLLMNDQNRLNSFRAKYAEMATVCEPIDFLGKNGSDEMLVGRSGFLCGVIFLRKYFNYEILSQEQLFKVCDSIIQSGRQYSMNYNTPSSLMYAYHGTEYLGTAHGLAGILQILMSFPEYLRAKPAAENYVKQSVDFMLSIQKPNGNFATAMDEVNHSSPRNEKKELIHWCHGATGVSFLLAKAYLHWREEKYLRACIKCADLIWQRGLLRKGPGICHGVGGSGLSQLLLYRLTNNKKYLYRAVKMADFLNNKSFKAEARTPDSPFSLFEGLAGTVCFLVDLLDPNQSEFPLMPVF